jgi:hypothetical protein
MPFGVPQEPSRNKSQNGRAQDRRLGFYPPPSLHLRIAWAFRVPVPSKMHLMHLQGQNKLRLNRKP